MGMLVQCKTGGEFLDVPEGQDPHTALDANGCGHCLDSHPLDVHCGRTANDCPRMHDGPCWNPPTVPIRPDGCTVCRPIVFYGTTQLSFPGSAASTMPGV